MLALFSCLQEMNTVPYLSKDQIATAREMDLLTYLRRFDPEELVHIGGNTYTISTPTRDWLMAAIICVRSRRQTVMCLIRS